MATTSVCDSFKVELGQGGHCCNATLTGVAVTNVSGTAALTGIASTAGWAVGMALTGTNVQAGTVVAAITGPTTATMSQPSSGGAVTSVTVTGDAFKLLLIKVLPSLTYNQTQTNVGTPGTGSPTTANVGTDEVSGTGYTSGGMALGNVTPILNSTTACWDFSPSPSLTGASISTTAGIIYNTSTRLGAAASPLSGRTCSIHDFGGTQTVTSGTITFTMPAQTAGNAIIQLA